MKFFRLVHQNKVFCGLFNSLKLLIWFQFLIWADFVVHLWCNLMGCVSDSLLHRLWTEEVHSLNCHSKIQNKHVTTDTNRYRFWEVTGRQFTTQGQHGTIALKTTSTSTKTHHSTMKQLIWRITSWIWWRTKKIEDQNKITESRKTAS